MKHLRTYFEEEDDKIFYAAIDEEILVGRNTMQQQPKEKEFEKVTNEVITADSVNLPEVALTKIERF